MRTTTVAVAVGAALAMGNCFAWVLVNRALLGNLIPWWLGAAVFVASVLALGLVAAVLELSGYDAEAASRKLPPATRLLVSYAAVLLAECRSLVDAFGQRVGAPLARSSLSRQGEPCEAVDLRLAALQSQFQFLFAGTQMVWADMRWPREAVELLHVTQSTSMFLLTQALERFPERLSSMTGEANP